MENEQPGGRAVRQNTLNQRTATRALARTITKKATTRARKSTTSSASTAAPVPSEIMSVPSTVLGALSPGKQKTLQDWVTANRVTINVPTIRVKQLNTNIKPPIFDELRKTPSTYLTELEAYLKSQGFEQVDFLDLLPSVLPDHTKSWLRAKKAASGALYTWSTFKADFSGRYDTPEQKQRRQHHLATKRQGEKEPVESFIWEMMDLAGQVYPTETTAESVQRCRDGLLPRLKLAVGELTTMTPEHLIDRCSQVVRDLRSFDKMEERKGKQPLPPMHPYNKERTFEGNDRPRNFHNFQGQRKFDDRNYSKFNQPGASQQRPSTSYQFKPKPEETKQGYANKKEFRRETRGTYGKPPGASSHANKDCYLCKKPGHIARFCPSAGFFYGQQHADEGNQADIENKDEYLNQDGEQ